MDWRARGRPMGFGIGLAKGIATVGRVGYEGRHDYTAIGNAVNLASRLCSAAEDGEIRLDPITAVVVAGAVSPSPIGCGTLKGFTGRSPFTRLRAEGGLKARHSVRSCGGRTDAQCVGESRLEKGSFAEVRSHEQKGLKLAQLSRLPT